jgi:hydroxyacylglutathione hydrolase
MKIRHFEFNPFRENTYILYDDSGECVIIDPGCFDSNEEELLTRFIESKKLKPVALLNTHCHIDHVFGNRFISEQYQLKPQIHQLEQKILQSAPMVGEMYGVEINPSPAGEETLEDGKTFRFGSTELKMIWAPGHSPGSICFYHELTRSLIGGDVLFQGSIGRTDLPGGDTNTLLRSIREKIFTLPDDFTVYPGHGSTTQIGEEKKYNPFLNDPTYAS